MNSSRRLHLVEPPYELLRGVLNYGTLDLEDYGPAGGSSGARIAADDSGNAWLVKHYSGDQRRVATELFANAIYRELGVLVPNAGTITWENESGVQSLALSYPMLTGELRYWREPNKELAKGFLVDALTANWDVIGLEHDNILWQGDVPIRLDQGGTFEFRAQGGAKEYGPEPVELRTMLGPQGQAREAMAVSEQELRESTVRAINRLTPEKVDGLSAATPFPDREMAARLTRNLNQRVAWLHRL